LLRLKDKFARSRRARPTATAQCPTAASHRSVPSPQIAPSYVFLASEDASFFTGTTLHPNGGTPVNS
jgi:NAD(P)-dependent dehydrogenase (short-subunit alcohol dehydrogenase family)